MRLRGLNTSARYYMRPLILAGLFALALTLYIFLRKKISMNKAMLIYSTLLLTGLNEKLCRFATAQAGHETAGFTSELFTKYNNAFGMNYAGQKLASGHVNEFATYSKPEDSATDFGVWWLKARNNVFSLPLFVDDIESYVAFLKNADYFTAKESDYLGGCVKYYKIYFGD